MRQGGGGQPDEHVPGPLAHIQQGHRSDPLATLPAHEDQASLDGFAVGEPHRTIIWRGCVRA
jgi:hypothetical protein